MGKTISQSDFKSYREAVTFVRSFSYLSLRENLGKKKIEPSFYLQRTRYFLDLLGSPHKGSHFIHITGTAGKGSVSNLLATTLTRNGYKVGLFTSPFVTTTAEQIQINGRYISAKDFVKITNYLKPFIAKMAESPFGPPAGFEILLTIALLYFRRQKTDWIILEAGLGGRFDATNVIKKPAITAITNIDYDHTELLGKTLKKIAHDKAGIIKKGSAFFTSEVRPLLLKIFQKICQENRASFEVIPSQKSAEESNKALVTRICRSLKVPERTIQSGLQSACLPCRFEIVQPGSKTKPIIILDGAHNRAKIRSTLNRLKSIPYENLTIVMTVSNTKKDNLAMVAPLAKVAHQIILTSTKEYERKSVHPKALLPVVIANKKKEAKLYVIPDCYEALEKARALAQKNKNQRNCILVTGSFFLAGQLRYKWYSEKSVLQKRSSF